MCVKSEASCINETNIVMCIERPLDATNIYLKKKFKDVAKVGTL